jgi:hypothetical protein
MVVLGVILIIIVQMVVQVEQDTLVDILDHKEVAVVVVLGV